MVKEIELTIPTDWDGVSLKKYLALKDEMKNYEDDEEAGTAVMLWHLCGLDPSFLKSISMQDYSAIRQELASFINRTELPLQRFVWINGVEYGFEPNLSKMSYGAYIDITQYKEITINDNWAKIIILFTDRLLKREVNGILLKHMMVILIGKNG